ncbi:Nucleolar protein 16 [Entophlyctis luteolus]|nr:Nucleolar protein 16 [Entophlyctis luteolus]KAJ3348814.1 Nucleolar protein 16 [Entophlyctis luteolus]
MVRPLQRKKQKNPHRKVSRKTKKMGRDRAKAVSFDSGGAMPIIARHWDKNLTLRQNYLRMGLQADLNGKAGGEGVARLDAGSASGPDSASTAPVIEYRSAEEFARMDNVSIASRKTRASRGNGDNEDNQDYDEVDDDFDVDGPIVVDPRAVVPVGRRLGLRSDRAAAIAPVTLAVQDVGKKIAPLEVNVVEALEEEAALGEAPRNNHASEVESEVLAALRAAHGDDYEAMARDRKRNKYQLSAGQLKRKFKKKAPPPLTAAALSASSVASK